jgi:hypothetical protein
MRSIGPNPTPAAKQVERGVGERGSTRCEGLFQCSFHRLFCVLATHPGRVVAVVVSLGTKSIVTSALLAKQREDSGKRSRIDPGSSIRSPLGRGESHRLVAIGLVVVWVAT